MENSIISNIVRSRFTAMHATFVPSYFELIVESIIESIIASIIQSIVQSTVQSRVQSPGFVPSRNCLVNGLFPFHSRDAGNALEQNGTERNRK